MKKVVLAVFMFLFSLKVSATSSSGYVDISDNAVLLVGGENSRLFVYGVTMNDSECDNKDVPVLLFSENDIAKEMYSMIMMAKTAGERVKIISGECVDLGGVTYNSITSAYME